MTAILTPATGILPPKSTWNGIRDSQDLIVDKGAMLGAIEFTGIGNLLGLPALVQPFAFDSLTNLPFSLQLMTKHWNEYDLFRIAHQVGDSSPKIDLLTPRRRPQVVVSPTLESLTRIVANMAEGHQTKISYYQARKPNS